ncbi:MAG: ATP-binding protein [Gemmatimonadaceae bacterium]|nr:ATP-binding protein [Gemmatimonadaceae bacterium]
MTALSLRARVLLALTGSVLVGGIAVAFAAHHLIQLQTLGTPGDREFSRAVWWALVLVAVAANVIGVGVAVVTTRTLTSRIARLRDAVLALGHVQDAPAAPPVAPAVEMEFAPLHEAVLEARTKLHDALTRVRMESDRNRAIIDTVFASIFAIDGGGRVLSANPAAARMFARPMTSLTGAILSDLLAPDSLRLSVDDLGTVRFTGNEDERRFTTRIRLYGRRAFPAEVAITPLVLDGQHAWAVFVHDLTEKQLAADALDEARRAAEAANRAKSAFLARMSHELRTPLNSMIGFTKIVRRSKSSELSERDRHYLDRVQAGSEHLLGLVSDILDLSHVESGTIDMTIERVDIAAIVTEIVAQFEPLVADRPVLLEADLPEGGAFASVDVLRLRQVITNLVGNAVKFTARGSVTVTVTLNHETGAASAILVTDSGIGIPLERQSRIFESFEQGGEQTSHRYGGSGLGLALSWRLAQQMGCMLSVESTPGAGSTFTFAFNRTVTAAAAPERHLESDAA